MANGNEARNNAKLVVRALYRVAYTVQGWDMIDVHFFVGNTSHLHNSTSIGELVGGLSAAYSSVQVEVPT